MSKAFKSPRKLNSLPPGTRVRFGDPVYGSWWRKCECERGCGNWSRWARSFDHDFMSFSAETLVHYNNGREFFVLEED